MIKLDFFKERLKSPKELKRFQRFALFSIIGICCAFIYGIMVWGESSAPHPKPASIAHIEGPLKSVDPRDIWVNRIEKEANKAKHEADSVKAENSLLQKRVDILEKLFEQTQTPPKDDSPPSPPLNLTDKVNGEHANPTPEIPADPRVLNPPSPILPSPLHGNAEIDPALGKTPKILHMGLPPHAPFKTKDYYIPSGTFARAILTSGVVASTSTSAQSNPQPIILRLVDEGTLPRGYKSKLRDAVLIGACYGDLSSERVLCRLEAMSWVESDGKTIERKVEGWIIGEDGRPGLKGTVVDRSTEVARESLIAGILSGMSQFLKFDASSSVYPVTPFGQTNAMSKTKALQGAAGSGASNALEKLADFSIKRAEQMQPVLMVASGRLVDVVFKKGIDLSPLPTHAELTLIKDPAELTDSSHSQQSEVPHND